MRGKDSGERLLGAILEAAVHGIVVSDAAGVIVRANTAAARLFGYQAADLLGQPVDHLMPESERPRHSGAMARYLRTGEARIIGTGRDVEGLRADGSRFPLHLSVGHARIDGRDFFVAILHDLSRQLEAERTLEQAHRLEALGELTGGVAHDFNNLLTVIIGNLELLEQSLTGDGRHGLVRDALDAAELGADLTAKLLALARRSVLAPCLVDPVASVEAALSLLRRTLGPGIDCARMSTAACGR
jgi:PAS domain S-box-containing protein